MTGQRDPPECGARLLYDRNKRSPLHQSAERPNKYMNPETKSTLSNNNLRRMLGWARAVYPGDWQDRCAVVTEFIAQLDEDIAGALIKKGWPEVFGAAEREWPEAFAGWEQQPAEQT